MVSKDPVVDELAACAKYTLFAIYSNFYMFSIETAKSVIL